MTREIKFRFWNKKDYGSNGDSFYQPANSMVEWENAKDDLNKWLNFEDENTLAMQFTGLLDKNGLPIFEGDILKSSYTEYGHKVIFENGGFKIKHSERCCPPYRTSLSEAEGWQVIIGNIYENPELLTHEDNK